VEIVLSQERDAGGIRTVWARTTNGALAIGGQDVGPGVESIFGSREYEWEIRIAPKDVPAAAEALEAEPGEDVLNALRRGWTGTRAHQIHARLTETGVNFSFWNRMGD
jgi:hypothetical protein